MVDLTAQREVDKLRCSFTQATEKTLKNTRLNWQFLQYSQLNEFTRSSIVIENTPESANLEIYLEDIRVAHCYIGRNLTSQEVKELKLLSNVFINQQRHINLCSFDQLTGVMNRQAFNEKVKTICKGIQHRNRRQIGAKKCLALIDIDHFKIVNDTFGHLIGDEVLVILGQILNATFRDDDLCFRFGGEEFAIILSNVTISQAKIILNRLKEKIENYSFPQVGTITISVGLSEHTPFAQPSELISQADKALYYSKEHGRNQTNSYPELVSAELIRNEEKISELEFL